MKDNYILEGHITREEIFYHKLVTGFKLPPIAAKAAIALAKEILLEEMKVPGGIGQIKYIAISEKEGPGRKIKDSEHVEVILTLDALEDLETYKKHGLSGYRQQVILRVTNEARDQGALLRIKDLVKLLKTSASTVKRDIKELRQKGFFVQTRGPVKDIGPVSHKTKIVERYIKKYTLSEISRSSCHSLKSVERYITCFARVLNLWRRGESLDSIRFIVGISERLAKEYVSLCEKYTDTEFQKRLDELSETPDVYIPPATFKKRRVRT